MGESGIEDIAPVSHAIFRVARTHKALAGRLLREAGLHPGQELLLLTLWDRGPQRMVDLAEAIESDASSLSRSVVRLEKAGLVTRALSSVDRRATIVSASPKSRELRTKIETAWQELEKHTTGPLTIAERRQALAGLAILENTALFDVGTTGRADEPNVPESARATQPPRRLRKDAAENAERLIAAAVRAGLGTNASVTMTQIAAEAGVGIGTLYRRYPTREALLGAMQIRAYRILIAEAEASLASSESGLGAVDRYLSRTFARRDEFVLPLHGAPLSRDAESTALRQQLASVLNAIVERGHADGSVRTDVTRSTIVRFGAMLAHPMTGTPGWDVAAAEQRMLFLRGIAPSST